MHEWTTVSGCYVIWHGYVQNFLKFSCIWRVLGGSYRHTHVHICIGHMLNMGTSITVKSHLLHMENYVPICGYFNHSDVAYGKFACPVISIYLHRIVCTCIKLWNNDMFSQRNCWSQVTAALAQAGLESSNLIVGIDFTKSNEWTGITCWFYLMP